MTSLFDRKSFSKYHRSSGRAAAVTLSKRRKMKTAQHAVIAAFLGLSVFFGLDAILTAGRTQTIVTAERTLRQGSVIRPKDVTSRSVPFDPAFGAAISSPHEAVGLSAGIDISKGSVILRNMTTHQPSIPVGSAIVRVRIANPSTFNLVGKRVSLLSPMACEQIPQMAQSNHANEQSPHQQAGDGRVSDDTNKAQNSEGICTIARSALAISEPQRDPSSETTIMEFALRPQEAVILSSMQDRVPIMAVTTKSPSNAAVSAYGPQRSRSLNTAQWGGSSPRIRLSSSASRCDLVRRSEGSLFTPSTSNRSLPPLTTRRWTRGERRLASYSLIGSLYRFHRCEQPRDRLPCPGSQTPTLPRRLSPPSPTSPNPP